MPSTPAAQPASAPDSGVANHNDQYVIGVDFGTLSGRALVVRVSDGAELGSAVHEYAHGVIEDALPGGRPLPPDWALQVPSDYVDVLLAQIDGAEPAVVPAIEPWLVVRESTAPPRKR